MRILILSLAVVFGLVAVPVIDSHVGSAVVYAAQDPPAQIDVDIDRGGGAWYANPVWIAIGVIALVIIVLLIVAASRGGGGTTVVRG
jgi:hypothetical protein